MTPICVIELLIRRLAFPTVNSAFHFALEFVREVTIILLHFLNPLVGYVRSHRLQEIVLCISNWLNSRLSVFSLSEKRETSTSRRYIAIFLPEAVILSTSSDQHLKTYKLSEPSCSHWHEHKHRYVCHLKILLLLPILHQLSQLNSREWSH
jgi:hypothetical protein